MKNWIIDLTINTVSMSTKMTVFDIKEWVAAHGITNFEQLRTMKGVTIF